MRFNRSNEPVRLQKKSDIQKSLIDTMEAWAYAHAPLILTLLILTGVALFVVMAYSIIGLSATESGLEYNQFHRII